MFRNGFGNTDRQKAQEIGIMYKILNVMTPNGVEKVGATAPGGTFTGATISSWNVFLLHQKGHPGNTPCLMTPEFLVSNAPPTVEKYVQYSLRN